MKYFFTFVLSVSCLYTFGQIKANKGDYAKYESEDVASFRQHFEAFQMPSVTLPKDDEVPVDKWERVTPYFADGKKIFLEVNPAMAQFVERHKKLTQVTGEVAGYRVQVFIGIEREAANAAKANFVAKFPGTACYLIFMEPSYRVRVGDFTTRIDAENFCRKVRGIPGLEGAFVVREDRVKVPKLRPISVSK